MVKGLITALVTPFNENGSVDYDSLQKLIEFQIANKVDGLLLLATTSEAESLTDDEKKSIVDYSMKIICNRVKVIVGLISNVTEKVVEQSKMYKDYDIDSYLVITPYYNKSNTGGLLKHFTYIADHVNKPIIIYNVPKRTGVNLDIHIIEALMNHKNIIGIKDATGHCDLQLEINRLNKNFLYYCGDDKLMLVSKLLGATGIISVISNAFPLECFKIFDEKNEIEFYRILNLINVMYNEVSPIGIKYILYILSHIKLNYRRPLDEPSLIFKRNIEENIVLYCK